METEAEKDDDSHVLISNIPPALHTSDLRKFFSDFVETEKFKCFHYRHRPEKGRVSEGGAGTALAGAAPSFSKQVCGRVHSADKPRPDQRPPNCCIAKLAPVHAAELVSKFHRKHWLDSRGEEVAARCFVFRVRLSGAETVATADTSAGLTYLSSELDRSASYPGRSSEISPN